MKKLQTLSLSAALLLVSANAVAHKDAAHHVKPADANLTHHVAHAKPAPVPHVAPASRGYAGIGIGNAEIFSDDTKETFEDTNLRVFMGYQLNQYFAIEAGVNSLPFDDLLGIADITGLDVSVLAILPVTSKLSAYGRLGYWDWDISFPFKGTSYELLGGTDKLYGIGLEYAVSPKISLRLDATRYDITDTGGVDTITGNIAYKF